MSASSSTQAGTPSRPANCPVTRSSSSATNAAGQSEGPYPAPRSAWWISTSVSRRNSVNQAGWPGPFRPWTGTSQAAAGTRATSSANSVADCATSAESSAAGRCAPASIPSSRACLLGYCGVSIPVRAQTSRLLSPSALRAMCVSTCPRLQPGSSEASRAWPSVSASAVTARRPVASWIRASSLPGSLSTAFSSRGPRACHHPAPHPGRASGLARAGGRGNAGRRQSVPALVAPPPAEAPRFVGPPGYHGDACP